MPDNTKRPLTDRENAVIQRAILRSAKPAPQPAMPEPAADYGSVDFGFTFAGLQLEDGDKRLLALLTNAFGNDHPAFDDLTGLVFAARTGAAHQLAQLQAERDAAEARCAQMVEALAELIACKDLHDQFDAMKQDVHDFATAAVLEGIQAEYQRRKPAAWANARAALATVRKG